MLTILKQIAKTGMKTERAPAADHEMVVVGRLQDEILRTLGRALAIRQVDAGSCNGCELEIHALNNPVYDVERFGIRFVASPRHADVLLVTGPVTRNMKVALERTYVATADPKWVVAAGDCACGCGVFEGSYAVDGAVGKVIPVDLHIRGCPPTPIALLEGLIALVEKAAGRNPPQL
jgi:Ni,Fe-hydrogenase III small subunit